jgi:hypothetical protein
MPHGTAGALATSEVSDVSLLPRYNRDEQGPSTHSATCHHMQAHRARARGHCCAVQCLTVGGAMDNSIGGEGTALLCGVSSDMTQCLRPGHTTNATTAQTQNDAEDNFLGYKVEGKLTSRAPCCLSERRQRRKSAKHNDQKTCRQLGITTPRHG